MNKKNKSQNKNLIHYQEIRLNDSNFSNSILAVNNPVCFTKEESTIILDCFVIQPINLKEKSRKFYDLKKNNNVDFNNKKLTKRLNELYPFDDSSKFYILKPSDTLNIMSQWFKNGEFPNNEVISLERICIKDTYGSSKVISLFAFVRNCICHGNFEIVHIGKNKKYIVLEDNTGSIIRGRGTIQLETLFSLLKTIKKYGENM